MRSILLIAGLRTVEHLILDAEGSVGRQSSGDSAPLAFVRTLEIRERLYLKSRDSHVKLIESMKDVLPALTQEVLQSVTVTFEGSSSCFQHLLQSLARTPILASFQNVVLGLSPKSITFVTATTKRNLRSSLGLTEELLKRSFPALNGRIGLRDRTSRLSARSLAGSVAGVFLTNLM